MEKKKMPEEMNYLQAFENLQTQWNMSELEASSYLCTIEELYRNADKILRTH